MEQDNKETAVGAAVSNIELLELSNIEAAKKLYSLVENRSLDDLFEIGEYIRIVAANEKFRNVPRGVLRL